MTNKEKQLRRLNILDIIYIVFLIVAIASYYLDSLQKEDVKNNSNENEKIIRNGKTILLIALLICYLYFVYDKYKNSQYGTPLENKLDIGASVLIVIALIILIYLEATGSKAIIDIV